MACSLYISALKHKRMKYLLHAFIAFSLLSCAKEGEERSSTPTEPVLVTIEHLAFGSGYEWNEFIVEDAGYKLDVNGVTVLNVTNMPFYLQHSPNRTIEGGMCTFYLYDIDGAVTIPRDTFEIDLSAPDTTSYLVEKGGGSLGIIISY